MPQNKDQRVYTTLSKETTKDLDEWSEEDNRSRSNLLGVIIDDAIAEWKRAKRNQGV